jgi:hypothetical protein
MPHVLIIEPQREMAAVLREIVVIANCTPLLVATWDEIQRLSPVPAAIVVRVLADSGAGAPHECVRRMPRADRPVVLALTATDADVTEAERLGCDVVLRAPKQVRGLYDTLSRMGRRH